MVQEVFRRKMKVSLNFLEYHTLLCVDSKVFINVQQLLEYSTSNVAQQLGNSAPINSWKKDADSNFLGTAFDVVIIDEASQALEAQCWVPLLRASKVVLAGDHLQLPPTIKSLNSKTTKAKTKTKDSEELIKGMTLETTLFDRLLRLHGPGIKRMLTTQYRMHEKIMRFPSDELYESKLVAADGVKARLLKDLPYEVKETEDTTEPLIFFDTQGGDFPEKNEEEEVDKKAGKSQFLVKISPFQAVSGVQCSGTVHF